VNAAPHSFATAQPLADIEAALEDTTALLLEPRELFDKAVLGYLESPTVFIYSAPKVLEILMREQDMSYEDAQEWFNFNIAGSLGEGYPLYLWPTEQAHAALTPTTDD
jgi:hypothetical protein